MVLDEEKNNTFIKLISWTQLFVAVQSFNFEWKNDLAEFWPMQSYIGNVTCDICHVTHPDKWHVNKMYYRDILQTCLLYHSVLPYIPNPPATTSLLDKKNLANGQICLETNSTHVASTRAVLEVEGG